MKKKRVLITGGSGFIGSNFIRYALQKANFKGQIINLDKMTYAANPLSLEDIERKYAGKHYFFEKIDICDYQKLEKIFRKYEPHIVVHFAAESHVDRSIYGPKDFVKTNIEGTFNLLEICRKFWGKSRDKRFHHISTDEVFGSLGSRGKFKESTPYNPRSPYSASKASSDHLVRAYFHTYGLPVTISNCSNNYGPRQYPEKLVPLIILNAIEGKNLPVYGDGKNVRDWLYVEDHCAAIYFVLKKGRVGVTYNIGANCEMRNIDLVKKLCSVLESEYPSSRNPKMKEGGYKNLIRFVKDRPGHDRRYAMDFTKMRRELNWKPSYSLDAGLRSTVRWYLDNPRWIARAKNRNYSLWIKAHYEE